MQKGKFLLIPLIVFCFCAAAFAQDIQIPGNWGFVKDARENDVVMKANCPVPQYLIDLQNQAEESGNEAEKIRLDNEIEKYLNVQKSTPVPEAQPIKKVDEPESPDWGIGDIKVHSGNVWSSSSYRQTDLKYGEDGWMYLAVNRNNVTGQNGSILVYRSSDGGRYWSVVQGVQSTAHYYSSITLLVERRHTSNNDSTRIFVYYTRSSTSNMNDASLDFVSFRRNGSAWYVGNVANPAAGNKFMYASACSDGMFASTGTQLHVVVQEATNAGVHVRLKHFRTTDWGLNHAVGNITTTADNDFYCPAIAFGNKNGNDSIYIAVERRWTTNETEIRLITVPEIPLTTTSPFMYWLTAATTGTNWRRPCVTVQQQYFSVPNKIMVGAVKDSAGKRLAYYCYSTTGGASWTWSYFNVWQNVDFMSCNSDSLTAGSGNFIMSYVDINGDSVSVRRGIFGNLGGSYTSLKRNSYPSTGVLAPVCAIYKSGTSKYASFAYAGSGPVNVYFNGENLAAVGIEPVGTNIPDKYALSQNYPNPFNPVTTINFSIPESKFIKLSIFNILGKEVAVLVNETLNAGEYNYRFDAAKLTSGIYFYKLTSDNFTEIKKMTLIK
jgi:hypothetical protein